jgi:hypothetical protein
MTLWNLPAELEDQFEEHWQHWLDEGERWVSFFEKRIRMDGRDLLAKLADFDLVDQAQIQAVGKLRRFAEGRSVPLSGTYRPDEEVITLFAAGFARGEKGSPAIPYRPARRYRYMPRRSTL